PMRSGYIPYSDSFEEPPKSEPRVCGTTPIPALAPGRRNPWRSERRRSETAEVSRTTSERLGQKPPRQSLGTPQGCPRAAFDSTGSGLVYADHSRNSFDDRTRSRQTDRATG